MSIRRTSVDRLNEARKSSLPTIGKGKPLNSQGNEGDLTFRRTSDGLMLYIKANHSWHGVKVGESFSNLESTINDIRSKVDVMKQFRLPSTYSVAGNFILDASGDIELNADGGDVKIYDGTAKHFVFDCNNTRMRIFDDTTESDFLNIGVGANGASTISTVDSDGAEGHLTFSPDGKIKFTAEDGGSDSIQCNVGGNTFASFAAEDGSYSRLKMYEQGGSSSADYMQLDVAEHGATTITTVDAAANAANLTITVDGDILLASQGHTTIDSHQTIVLDSRDTAASGMGTIFKHNGTETAFINQATLNLAEAASANSDRAGYGQIWIKNDTPNELCFTDDAGTDITGIGKYHYQVKNIAYFSAAQANYLPMNGYVIERTSTASNNEHIAFVAPYNGTLEKFMFRSEAGQDGAMSLRVLESSDGTEVPGSSIFRKDLTVDIADDTTLEYDMTSPGTGSFPAALTKGRIYAIYLSTPSNSSDTNVTVVFKWDVTS